MHLMRAALIVVLLAMFSAAPARAQASGADDWRSDAPGVAHHVEVPLPQPFATRSASNGPSIVVPPPGAMPKVPAGFTVQRFVEGLENPRLMRTAPNGDIFIAETAAGRVRVLRAADGATKPTLNTVFAADLELPFGIAFHPAGSNPRFVYIATVNAILRFPYRVGETRAGRRPEIVVPQLTRSSGGHITRDVMFTPDGTRMLVSIGSASNVAQGLARRPAGTVSDWEARNGVGAAWGEEEHRAAVLSFDSDGGDRQVFATGIRNCVGMATHPVTGDVWCSTNERDGLGDNLPPDYVSRIRQGGFYGWPWFYIGANEDPRHKGARTDLASRVIVPDILLQAHSAPLQMTFYPPGQRGPAAFPPAFQGDAFVALHGSWNRAKRTGYKIIRVHLQNGVPAGGYEDFMTGFVTGDENVWGRPVGLTVAHDGALLVTDDGSGTIWRIAHQGY